MPAQIKQIVNHICLILLTSFYDIITSENSNVCFKIKQQYFTTYHNIIKKIKKAHKYYCLFSAMIHIKHLMLILYFEHNHFFYFTTPLCRHDLFHDYFTNIIISFTAISLKLFQNQFNVCLDVK